MTTLHVELSSVTHNIFCRNTGSNLFHPYLVGYPENEHEKHSEGRTVLWLIQKRCTMSQRHQWTKLGAGWITWHIQIAGFWEWSVNFETYPDVSMGIHLHYLAAGTAACAWRYTARCDGQNVSSNVSFSFGWVVPGAYITLFHGLSGLQLEVGGYENYLMM